MTASPPPGFHGIEQPESSAAAAAPDRGDDVSGQGNRRLSYQELLRLQVALEKEARRKERCVECVCAHSCVCVFVCMCVCVCVCVHSVSL